MKAMQRWIPAEDDQLYQLHKVEKKSIKEVAAVLDRSEHSVEARWRWLHVSEEEREKRRQREYERRRNLGMSIRGKAAKCGRVESIDRICPEQVFIDRARRDSAPRTLTAIVCGDPPPGWSALDRRGSCQ